MKLPAIDLEKITTLSQANNAIEQLLQTQIVLLEKIQQLREELNHLKGQPKKPSFASANQNRSTSVTSLLKENRSWHKSSKKGKIPIDRREQLSEIDACSCGSTSFTTIRTTKKIVQGIIFQRDNVLHAGRVKQCNNCGKHYRSILPSYLRGVSFSPSLSSFLSFWHYGCRVTLPLLLQTMTGIYKSAADKSVIFFLRTGTIWRSQISIFEQWVWQRVLICNQMPQDQNGKKSILVSSGTSTCKLSVINYFPFSPLQNTTMPKLLIGCLEEMEERNCLFQMMGVPMANV